MCSLKGRKLVERLLGVACNESVWQCGEEELHVAKAQRIAGKQMVW